MTLSTSFYCIYFTDLLGVDSWDDAVLDGVVDTCVDIENNLMTALVTPDAAQRVECYTGPAEQSLHLIPGLFGFD